MKKITFIFFALVSSMCFAQTSDLYFSMYGESGSGNNKFLEIYNGTGADVDVTTYSIVLFPNGNGTPGNTYTFDVGTVIPDGEVFVIVHPDAGETLLNLSGVDAAHNVTSFNGNDAVALYDGGELVDIIGDIEYDSLGDGWTVGSTTNGTKDHILIRKSDICSPNPNPTESFGITGEDSEWEVHPFSEATAPEFDQIGSHTACETSSIGKNQANAFVIFPNPTSNGKVNIKTISGAEAHVVVYDILGKRVASKSLDAAELNISNLKSGIYLVQVTQNGATTTKKLIVE